MEMMLGRDDVLDFDQMDEVGKRMEAMIKDLAPFPDRRKDFLKGLYRAHRILEKETLEKLGVNVACSKGCGFCCYQIVPCFFLEAELIMDYLSEQSFDYKTKKQMKKKGQQQRKYIRSLLSTSVATGDKSIYYREAHNTHESTPCLFLSEDNSCLIYDVRPIPCRTYRTLERCTSVTDINDKSFVIVDGIMSSLLLANEKRLGQEPADYFMIARLDERGIFERL